MARRHAQARAAAGEGNRAAAYDEQGEDSETCEPQTNLLP